MLFLVEAFVGAFQDPCAVEDGDEGFVGAFFGLDLSLIHICAVFIGFYKKVSRAKRGCVVSHLTLLWKRRCPTLNSYVGRMSCISYRR